MTTRRTPKSTAKKSLGNLLREEVQKEPDQARDIETRETPAPEGKAPDQNKTNTIKRSSRGTPQESESPAASAPEPTAESAQVNADLQNHAEILAHLERLQTQLEQAQQQNAALSHEKADLEDRLKALCKNLNQEAQLKTQAQQQVDQLQAELNRMQTQLTQPQPSPSTTLAVLPRSAHFPTLALPRAFSRPIVDRPTPWEIPRRPLVITGTTPASPSDLSDEDIGWFD